MLELDVADRPRSASGADLATGHPDLNILINNAGIMASEDLGGARDLGIAEATVTTNLLGPIRLTDALIDHLKSHPDAAIINVSSGLASVPLVSAPTYSATKAAIHSYTLSLREALKGKVEVIELIPPGVQTELTPGQSTREGYMPLDDYIDEVMSLFERQPTPPEIAVDRVKFLRNAEAENRFAATSHRSTHVSPLPLDGGGWVGVTPPPHRAPTKSATRSKSPALPSPIKGRGNDLRVFAPSRENPVLLGLDMK